jgi:ribose-phosphate pyrophosphokinase
VILPASTSQSLAVALATETGRELAPVEYRRFPDGELMAAAPSLADADADEAVVVAATTSSDAHLECVQLQDAAREAGVERVTTVLPYMGYARQDEAFKPGQPVSARAAARAISAGTDRAVLVNPHERAVADFFDVPCATVDATPRLAAALPTDLEAPLFLSPDEGAVELARTVRDAYGRGDTDYFRKQRDRDTGDVTVEPSDAPVVDRDVVVVDDIVATGSTMSEAVALLHERDVGRVLAACVHPMLAGNARTKLARAGVERVVATDTVERDVSVVSAAPVVAGALSSRNG